MRINDNSEYGGKYLQYKIESFPHSELDLLINLTLMISTLLN
ncbi:hypothetical protein RCH19_000010 [Flavobacterium sp. PL12]